MALRCMHACKLLRLLRSRLTPGWPASPSPRSVGQSRCVRPTFCLCVQPDIQFGRDALPDGEHLHWQWPLCPETHQPLGEAEFKTYLQLGAAADKDISLRILWCLPDGREVPQPPVEVEAKYFYVGAINCIELQNRKWRSLLAPPPAPPGVSAYLPTITIDTGVSLAVKIPQSGAASDGTSRPIVWVVVDAEECARCNRHVRVAENVLCDDCGRAAHLECEGLKKVPKGAWRCSQCNPKQAKKRPGIKQEVRLNGVQPRQFWAVAHACTAWGAGGGTVGACARGRCICHKRAHWLTGAHLYMYVPVYASERASAARV